MLSDTRSVYLATEIGLPDISEFRDAEIQNEYRVFCSSLREIEYADAVECDIDFFDWSGEANIVAARCSLFGALFGSCSDIFTEIQRRIRKYSRSYETDPSEAKEILKAILSARNSPKRALETQSTKRRKRVVIGVEESWSPANYTMYDIEILPLNPNWYVVLGWFDLSIEIGESVCLPWVLGFVLARRRAFSTGVLLSRLENWHLQGRDRLTFAGFSRWEEFVLSFFRTAEDESDFLRLDLGTVDDGLIRDLSKRFARDSSVAMQEYIKARQIAVESAWESYDHATSALGDARNALEEELIPPRSPLRFDNSIRVDQLSKEDRIAIERWLRAIFRSETWTVEWKKAVPINRPSSTAEAIARASKPPTVFEVSWGEGDSQQSVLFDGSPYPRVREAFREILKKATESDKKE